MGHGIFFYGIRHKSPIFIYGGVSSVQTGNVLFFKIILLKKKKTGRTMNKKNLGYFFISFLTGIFLGVVFVKLLGATYVERVGLFSNYFFRQYQELKIDCDQVFFFVWKKRMTTILFLWLMGMTSAGVVLTLLYSGYLGFMAGIVAMTAILRMGWQGGVIVMISLMPQIFVYSPAMIFLLNEIYEKGRKRRTTYWVRGRREIDWRYGRVFAVVNLIFFLGIMLESYVNPVILQYLLKRFLG